jgi:hypothetical protein
MTRRLIAKQMLPSHLRQGLQPDRVIDAEVHKAALNNELGEGNQDEDSEDKDDEEDDGGIAHKKKQAQKHRLYLFAASV